MQGLLAAAALPLATARAAAEPQATSPDGRWQVLAEGPAIAVFERGLRVKTLAAASRDGHQRSAMAELHHLSARRSFVIVFDTLAELWELSIDPQAAPIHDGLVHDWRLGEAIAEPGFLGARRTRLEQPLPSLAVDDSGAFVLGCAAARRRGGTATLVDVRGAKLLSAPP